MPRTATSTSWETRPGESKAPKVLPSPLCCGSVPSNRDWKHRRANPVFDLTDTIFMEKKLKLAKLCERNVWPAKSDPAQPCRGSGPVAQLHPAAANREQSPALPHVDAGVGDGMRWHDGIPPQNNVVAPPFGFCLRDSHSHGSVCMSVAGPC